MADCYYQLQVDTIKAILSKKTNQQYLNEQITLPHFDEDRIAWMSYIIRDCNVDTVERQSYIAATMLAQLALDIHDQASDSHIPFKQRQLSILAGDYFSGIYYHLLSEYQNISLIKSLASAIKKINEYKIKLHHDEYQNTDSYFACLKIIESALVKQFSAFYDSDQSLIQFIDEFLFLKRILLEMENLKNGLSSVFMNKLKHISNVAMEQSYVHDDQRIMKESSIYAHRSLNTLESLSKSILDLPVSMRVRLDELKLRLENISGILAGEG